MKSYDLEEYFLSLLLLTANAVLEYEKAVLRHNMKKEPQGSTGAAYRISDFMCFADISHKPFVDYALRIENRFIIKAIIMPIVVSRIRAMPKDKGLSSFPCVTVMHRKTTHMRNVPFSRFIKTEKLMMGIRSTDKNRYRSTSHGLHQKYLSNSSTIIPHIPPIIVATSLLNASRKPSFRGTLDAQHGSNGGIECRV